MEARAQLILIREVMTLVLLAYSLSVLFWRASWLCLWLFSDCELAAKAVEDKLVIYHHLSILI